MITLKLDPVNLHQIAASGQCFRMRAAGTDGYDMPVGALLVRAQQLDSTHVRFSAAVPDNDLEAAMRAYFDADTDYRAAIDAIAPQDAYLSEAARAGAGIRILRQPLWETIASFIISQNNNIPRIRRIIARLSGGELAPFPDAPYVAAMGEDALRQMGAGYRARYLAAAAERFTSQEADALRALPYEAAREQLMGYSGIGAKVADCVCLFALGHKQAFPTDVWVRRILQTHYPQGFSLQASPCAGIYQQYMFAHERELAKQKPSGTQK